MKEQYHSVDCKDSTGNKGFLSFHKNKDGKIELNVEGECVIMKVSEAKELAEKLKKCAAE